MIESFSPLINGQPHTLILGSIPGIASLKAQQYYAHPRNAFWPIMANIIGFDPDLDYDDRCTLLTNAGYALWDSIGRCHRQGSLDSAIKTQSEIANPIASLLSQHQSIVRIVCNGSKSRQSLRKYCDKSIPKEINIIQLPSTSPAHASLSMTEKLSIWRNALLSK